MCLSEIWFDWAAKDANVPHAAAYESWNVLQSSKLLVVPEILALVALKSRLTGLRIADNLRFASAILAFGSAVLGGYYRPAPNRVGGDRRSLSRLIPRIRRISCGRAYECGNRWFALARWINGPANTVNSAKTKKAKTSGGTLGWWKNRRFAYIEPHVFLAFLKNTIFIGFVNKFGFWRNYWVFTLGGLDLKICLGLIRALMCCEIL